MRCAGNIVLRHLQSPPPALRCAGNIVGGDVVELNPQRDTVDSMTAMVAAKLVRELAARIAK